LAQEQVKVAREKMIDNDKQMEESDRQANTAIQHNDMLTQTRLLQIPINEKEAKDAITKLKDMADAEVSKALIQGREALHKGATAKKKAEAQALINEEVLKRSEEVIADIPDKIRSLDGAEAAVVKQAADTAKEDVRREDDKLTDKSKVDEILARSNSVLADIDADTSEKVRKIQQQEDRTIGENEEALERSLSKTDDETIETVKEIGQETDQKLSHIRSSTAEHVRQTHVSTDMGVRKVEDAAASKMTAIRLAAIQKAHRNEEEQHMADTQAHQGAGSSTVDGSDAGDDALVVGPAPIVAATADASVMQAEQSFQQVETANVLLEHTAENHAG